MGHDMTERQSKYARAIYDDQIVSYDPEEVDDVTRAVMAVADEEVAALCREPYVLADILCHLYHDYEICALTGIMTDRGFVVSCADCKSNARQMLTSLWGTLNV